MQKWILLVYKIPNEPSAGRVFVWRKLKKLGAILHHDAVWVLPSTPQTREHFRWLTAEIVELHGEASVWDSRLTTGDEDALMEQFNSAVAVAYQEILSEMSANEPDLASLSRRYQQVRARDYFDSTLGKQLRDKFIAAKGGNQ